MNSWTLVAGGSAVTLGMIASGVSAWKSGGNEIPGTRHCAKFATHDRAESAQSVEAALPRKRSEKSRNEDVSMATRFRRKGTVKVGGQVGKPGPVPCAENMTLWQAIQEGGGVTEFGSLRRVKLIRDGQQKTYDLTKPEYQTVILQRNDAVEVPQKVGS